MKIEKYGTVIIGEGPIKIDGWLVKPELTDPPEATPEQMLLEVVIPWAQKKLNAAILSELQRVSTQKKAAAALTKNPTEN
jgi:hypothetical protein